MAEPLNRMVAQLTTTQVATGMPVDVHFCTECDAVKLK